MSIIKYEFIEGYREIDSVMPIINDRYQNLKETMLNALTINKLHKQKIQKIQQYLTELNKIYEKYSPEQIEELLRNLTTTSMNTELQEILSQISANIQSFDLNADMDNKIRAASQDEVFIGLGKIYDLYQKISSKGGRVRIDSDSFMSELATAYRNLLSAQQGFKTLSNAIGNIGAVSAGLLIQDTNQQLIDSTFAKSKNVITYDTGKKKTIRNNRTVTTDTVSLVTQSLPEKEVVTASLRLSAKFNMAYSKDATSTKTPVKLVTRNVRTFLKKEAPAQFREQYEIALINYLSYHATYYPHFKRFDFIQEDREGWKNLRKAMGAEMLYNELYAPGKGSLKVNEHTIKDSVDIYIYGNKLFLASDILKSQYMKRNSEITPAQVALTNKKKLLTTANIQSMPVQEILKEPKKNDRRKEKVVQMLQTSTITYSQVINFF